jgi:hypothetical protein
MLAHACAKGGYHSSELFGPLGRAAELRLRSCSPLVRLHCAVSSMPRSPCAVLPNAAGPLHA